MSDKLKGAATRSTGPFGSGATGGPWPMAPLKNDMGTKYRVGGDYQSRHSFATNPGLRKIAQASSTNNKVKAPRKKYHPE